MEPDCTAGTAGEVSLLPFSNYFQEVRKADPHLGIVADISQGRHRDSIMWEDALFPLPFPYLGCWFSAGAGEVKGKLCPCVP